MHVLIAPDSFKDALPAKEVAHAIAHGIADLAEVDSWETCPVSDGGEGFRAIITVDQPGLKTYAVETFDPLSRPTTASWAMTRDALTYASIAVIELAAASGLELLGPDERNPMQTTTRGTGLVLKRALDQGVSQIILGIGSSATCDAGCGIAQALGVRFYDAADLELADPICGGDLLRIARIDRSGVHPRLEDCPIRVACDVTNPLTGPNGAAYIYGPQKGASPGQVAQLDAGLKHIAQLWREQLGKDVETLPGAGAAGGAGGGLVAMLDASLVPGAELVLDAIGFEAQLQRADLVITGEGQLDGQSLQGKAVVAVAQRAAAAGVPCVALVGSVEANPQAALEHGLTSYHVIGEGLSKEDSIRRTSELLAIKARQVVQQFFRP